MLLRSVALRVAEAEPSVKRCSTQGASLWVDALDETDGITKCSIAMPKAAGRLSFSVRVTSTRADSTAEVGVFLGAIDGAPGDVPGVKWATSSDGTGRCVLSASRSYMLSAVLPEAIC